MEGSWGVCSEKRRLREITPWEKDPRNLHEEQSERERGKGRGEKMERSDISL